MNSTTLNSDPLSKQLFDMERATVAAFKRKDDRDFSKYFAADYIGVANDGIKTAADEITGMHKLDLEKIDVTDERINFPVKDVAILTYIMVVKGRLGDTDISCSIYTSTVYANQGDTWKSVLHTESTAT
ncbi:MAG: hypothetical protein JWM78_3675 [Verrucomicrobiaceae bacterium]|nr:hypothetical protein [Verrucomicrobiaceae bacterium]